MADYPNEQNVIDGIKRCLEREKSKLFVVTSNVHKLRDLSMVFNELNRLTEDVVKGKYGSIRDRHKHELANIYPMLERLMKRIHSAIMRRLSPRMSRLHLWLICFDVAMPQELFTVLHETILGLTQYGLDVQVSPNSVTLTFTSLRRLEVLFNEFLDTEGFVKRLGVGKGIVKLIVNDEKKAIFCYKIKDEILRGKIHY